ncbi:hypothetical protein K474DRAFT_1650931 [Panus rudis PR-1116 ss-1]|nr:hypothetical protein K474DRAFT_1650931 [Panus rudis PR-1116 ss-1]
MKFFALVPLFFAFSSVMASGLTRRHHNDIVQARQAKLRRDIDVDICASLDLDLTLPNILREGNVGHLDVALCVSIVEEFVKSNPVCQAASLLIGVDEVITIIIELIKGAGNKRQCSLPNHGHSKCSHDDLCSFDCQHGYQPYTAPGDSSPSQCTCPAPLSECNGQCGNFPNGCGSATPQRRNTRRAGPPSCPVGQQICGVPGSSGWDCVDVKTDRESCKSMS